MRVQEKRNWSIADSAALYGIEHWGEGDFSIDTSGDITITIPFSSGEVSVPFIDIIQAARDRDHPLPLLLLV